MSLTYFADILGLGTPELVIIVVIILLLFGGSQLPKIARNVGSSAKELRKGLGAVNDDKKPENDAAQENNTDSKRG